jgi:glycosyltransferase involved in cell wall biosynthesis
MIDNERFNSIFREYYAEKPFIDRFLTQANDAIDVIIPVVHTNELWEANLLSFYREIPINKLLIGDGGCIDDSISIAEKFPRVRIFDHRTYKSLGYSIRKLIEAVEADWFVYIHSDAYLPPGWFDAMQKHQIEYDWFGCPMRHTVMVEYNGDYGERPWAGSQMGRKKAFEAGLSRIDDDYVYRQEDFVFADIVQKAGFIEGKVTDTFHYHQTMHKPTPWSRKVKSVQINVELSREEEVRTWLMQGKGIIKYLQPSNDWLIDGVLISADYLISNKELTWGEFQQWVRQTNPKWLPYIRRGLFKRRLKNRLLSLACSVGRFLFRG